MGDVRFDRALERAQRAHERGQVGTLTAETGVEALGAMASEADAVLANVLATRVLNQFRRSATLLRFVAEGVVALDPEGRVLFANPAAEEMLGYAHGELLGRDMHETVRHHDVRGIEIARGDCPILRALNGHDASAQGSGHDAFTRKDGTTFAVGFTAAPILHEGRPSGIALLFRDVTEAKEREAALTLHVAALDAVPDPVFWIDRNAWILYANKAAVEHLGYDRDELLQMSVFDVDVAHAPAQWEEHWASIRRGVKAFTSKHRARDGRLIVVDVTARQVVFDDAEFQVAVARPRRD